MNGKEEDKMFRRQVMALESIAASLVKMAGSRPEASNPLVPVDLGPPQAQTTYHTGSPSCTCGTTALCPVHYVGKF